MKTGNLVRQWFLIACLLTIAASVGLGPRLYAQPQLGRTARTNAAPAGQRALMAGGAAFSAPTDFPAIFPNLRNSLQPVQDLGALRRVLAQTRLEPRELGAMPAADRAQRISAAVKEYVLSLAAEAAVQTRPTDNPVRSIMELTSLKYRFEDMLAAAKLMGLQGQGGIDRVLGRNFAEVNSALIARSEALSQKILAALPDAADVVWHGRTAVVPVGADGSALALKFAKPGKGVEAEGAGMERAGRFGIDAPAPLPGRDGYVRPIDARSPQAQYGTAFMAYLLPGKLAGEFFSYLGDPLPLDWSREQKAQAVRSSALRAVDGLLRLQENGWHHETLAPLSHSEAKWQWDFWRKAGGTTFLELSRFGPSNIHNWEEGLSFANIRLSGLADFEHLAPSETRFSEDSLLRKDLGQNIFELSMLLIRAGYRNKLGAGQVSEILAEVLRRHASGIPGGRPIEINRPVLFPLLKGMIRRFYSFYAVARATPRFLVRHFNDAVSRASTQTIPEGAALVMPGEILHPLIMDVIKPYVEALIGGVHESDAVDGLGAPYRDRLALSDEKDSAILLPLRPVLALLFGLETAPYLSRLGRFRRSWIWEQGTDPDIQARRKKSAALIGRQDAGSLELIEKALADPNAQVRRYAAQALQGRRDADSWALIKKALADPNAQVRGKAVTALQVRREAGVLALIAQALEDQDAQVRGEAAEVLQSRWEAGALPLIAQALEDQDAQVRGEAAKALLGRGNPGSVALIEKTLKNQDEQVRGYAAQALKGREDAGSLALIEKALEDQAAQVRGHAAEALQGRQDAGSLRLIIKILADKDAQVRGLAGLALKGRRDADSLALIAQALEDSDARVRSKAAEALQGRQEADSLALIAQALEDSDAQVRCDAAMALIGSTGPGALALTQKALDDPDAQVRSHAVMTLQSLLEEGSLKLIEKALEDPEAQVRLSAVLALQGHQEEGSLALVKKALKNQNAQVRGLAAKMMKVRQ
ncbi:MAG TPA: hypothetical protein DEB40_08275 [Elusimicrobia bacterium]|nr:hypothetical protein [Elusimicrobiota bacterium]HBT61725.1 hypothetical protein [Elusimicrobiota bacterium]